MNCPFCGTPLSENADFCDNCGSFISETESGKNVKPKYTPVTIPMPDTNDTPPSKQKSSNQQVLTTIIALAIVALVVFAITFFKPKYYGSYKLDQIKYEYNGETTTVSVAESGLSADDLKINLNKTGDATVTIFQHSNMGGQIKGSGKSVKIVYSNVTIRCEYDKTANTLSIPLSEFDGLSINVYTSTASNPFLPDDYNSNSSDYGNVTLILKKY